MQSFSLNSWWGFSQSKILQRVSQKKTGKTLYASSSSLTECSLYRTRLLIVYWRSHSRYKHGHLLRHQSDALNGLTWSCCLESRIVQPHREATSMYGKTLSVHSLQVMTAGISFAVTWGTGSSSAGAIEEQWVACLKIRMVALLSFS